MPFFPNQGGGGGGVTSLPINLFLADGNSAFSHYLNSAVATQHAHFDDTLSMSFFKCVVPPSGADATFILGLNGIAKGEITIPDGQTTGTFAQFGSGGFDVAVGDLLETAPASAEPNVLTISFALIPNTLL